MKYLTGDGGNASSSGVFGESSASEEGHTAAALLQFPGFQG